LTLRYRSAAAFLLAYASRFSRGEVFLEDACPLKLGTRAVLRLETPGATVLEIEGRVAWTRPIAIGPGQPAGMGIAIASSIEAYGTTIDRLASRYARPRILIAGAEATARAVIGRYVRSILACDVAEMHLPITDGSILTDIGDRLDLAFIDLDSEREAGFALIQLLKHRARTEEVPIIALARLERDRASAAVMGVDEVLATPPLFTEVQATAVHILSRPTAAPLFGNA
jgi:Tfp pilus assembly protein PilZ